jgi:GrpB-like predicted nucleotidyltransferase (UPF0157 family)
MKRKRIVVKPYSPTWEWSFLLIRKRLQRVLPTADALIHHIGSTAIEGLPAKPIIDIDVEIHSIRYFEDTKQKLYRLGYHHVGDQGIKGREVFKLTRWHLLPRHHLYVCVTGNSELKRHLAFKDYLNTHEDMKKAYGEIKIAAAKKHPYDMDAYLAMKGTLIQKIYQAIGLE